MASASQISSVERSSEELELDRVSFILFSPGDFKFSSLSERLELLVRFFLFDVINLRIFQLNIICKKRKYGERPNTRLLTPHTSTQSILSVIPISQVEFIAQMN